MRADALLTELEPLAYPERCRRLADLRRGAGAAGPKAAELDGLLAELGGLGHYERSIALLIASVVRDDASLAHLRRAVRDPDAESAKRAIGLAVRLGIEGGVFQELLEDAPAAVRAATYQAIRTWRRSDLAESLIDPVTARWGDREGASLLPACGERVAAERLADLAHAVPNWKAFARAHPGLMLDHAERELAELPPGVHGAWWSRHSAGVAAAVPCSPARVVGLLERHWTHGPLPAGLLSRLGLLLDAEPARTPAVLLAPAHRRYLAGYGGPLWRRSVRDRLARLGDDDLIAVATAVRENEAALTLLLKSLAPSRRDQILTGAMSGIDLTTRELGDALMEVLPTARRTREAERMLGLRRVAETPARHRAVTAFLPYERAAPELLAVTRRTDAADRAEGYRLLIACAGRSRDPAALTGLLESLARLRNEQDPVRLAAIEAFAAMPPGLVRPVHVPAFGRLVDDALAARDCSFQTRHALVRLATRVFEQGAIRDDRDVMDFAFETFARLTGHMGSIYLGRLDRMLRKGQEHDLVGRLAARLEAEADRDEHRLAFTLAHSLGRRGHDVPQLQDAIERALDARSDADIQKAVELWLAPPRSRAERVAVVLAKDPSTVHLRSVFAVIARQRTDLLHRALSGRMPKGRFGRSERSDRSGAALLPGVLTGRTPQGRFRRPDVVYVPTAEQAWMRRWTATQRSAYLALLHRLARDPDVPDFERGAAVRIIGEVPGATSAELRPYLDSPDDHLRRVALTAVVRTASPQAVLPDLLALASTGDAHVAIHAATRAARFTAPSALAGALAPVLVEGKITARKEALRLLVGNRVPGAADRLAAAWDDPGQHHDVKAAIVSAARRFLAEPAAMRVLTEAAAGAGTLARHVLGTDPLQVEPRWRGTYAELILRVAHSADPETRTAALLAIPAWAAWAPGSTGALAALAADLGSTESWRPALRSLVTCAASGVGVDDLRDLTARLAAAPTLHDAETERDLPAAQRLDALAEAVRDAARTDRDGARPMIGAVGAVLPEPLAAELIAATFRWDDPDAAAVLDDLAGRPIGGALAADLVARALADSLDGPFDGSFDGSLDGSPGGSLDGSVAGTALSHAARLAARGDRTGGLLAAALAGHEGPRTGWPLEWRDLLRRLRRHPHPDVTYTAGTVRTAAE